jgi:hypothetical protein
MVYFNHDMPHLPILIAPSFACNEKPWSELASNSGLILFIKTSRAVNFFRSLFPKSCPFLWGKRLYCAYSWALLSFIDRNDLIILGTELRGI